VPLLSERVRFRLSPSHLTLLPPACEAAEGEAPPPPPPRLRLPLAQLAGLQAEGESGLALGLASPPAARPIRLRLLGGCGEADGARRDRLARLARRAARARRRQEAPPEEAPRVARLCAGGCPLPPPALGELAWLGRTLPVRLGVTLADGEEVALSREQLREAAAACAAGALQRAGRLRFLISPPGAAPHGQPPAPRHPLSRARAWLALALLLALLPGAAALDAAVGLCLAAAALCAARRPRGALPGWRLQLMRVRARGGGDDGSESGSDAASDAASADDEADFSLLGCERLSSGEEHPLWSRFLFVWGDAGQEGPALGAGGALGGGRAPDALARTKFVRCLRWRRAARMDEALEMAHPYFHFVKAVYPHAFHGRTRAGGAPLPPPPRARESHASLRRRGVHGARGLHPRAGARARPLGRPASNRRAARRLRA